MKNILLIIVVIIAVVLGGLWLKTSVDKSKSEDTLNEQISLHKSNIDKKTAELDVANASIKTHKAKLEKSSKELKGIKEGQLSAAKEEIAKREDKITQLENSGKDLQTKLAAINKQLEVSQADVDAKDKQVANLKQIITTKDTKINELNANVTSWKEKEKFAVTTAESYQKMLLENKIPIVPEKKFVGHILTIHEDPDFLIIDLGLSDDLPVGEELRVVRDNHYIGKIVVEKLLSEDDKNLSYAIVKSLSDENNSVREGDLVSN